MRPFIVVLCLCLCMCLVHSREPMRTKRAVDPDAFRNISELIISKGYPAEEHTVVTSDGYILSMSRIPFGIKNQGNSVMKPVVFLQHGFLGDGSQWVTNLANNSLGFILADADCDVWIGNTRGNILSRSHQHLSVDQDEFWAFSFDEMAKFDLPAMINYVLEKTGQQQLYYVGHSQGTTIAFIAFSTMPELAQKIKMFFALAPVTRLEHAKTPAINLFLLPEGLLRIVFGKREFLPQNWLVKQISTTFCGLEPFSTVCGNFLFLIGGYNKENMNMSRVHVYAARFPAGASTQNMFHWAQVYYSGLLKGYDWGDEIKNEEKHNQITPPVYKIEEMAVPTAVWSGGADLFADPEDVADLIPRIQNLVSYKHIPEWTHLDFIWGMDAFSQVYTEIIDLINKSHNPTSKRGGTQTQLNDLPY